MPTLDTARIDIERFWTTVERSAEIGPGRPGGLSRLALSDADKGVRDIFVGWCREAGLTVRIDGIGNIFARRAGTDDSLPPVVMGSHLDTQINGGRFDGIAGVLGGLEVCRTLDALGHRTRRPVEIVNWTNEEGARFSPPMVGSGCFVGAYCPSSDDLRRFSFLRNGGSGSSGFEAMRPAAGAASVFSGWSGA